MRNLFIFATFCFLQFCSSHGYKLEETPNGNIWGYLVAGSQGFYNYRHQADVCHAYQVLHSHGVPDENIVVMMMDDIAYNPNNPPHMKGKIINRPNGPNVYEGVPHDYTGGQYHDASHFLEIFEGKHPDNNTSLKTLKSGPDDHVFVFFSDHGAPGILGFGRDYLKATDFIDSIKRKHANKGFKKLVIYVEACESGSMFKNLLPDDIDVYVTTAANSTQSSFACYFSEDLGTFLGDVYSVKWLEDSDRENLRKETLISQFELVRYETNTSHVEQFGDLSIGKYPVGFFQGLKSPGKEQFEQSDQDACGRDQVPVGDVQKTILEHKLRNFKGTEREIPAQQELDQHIEYRSKMDRKVRSIIETITEQDMKVVGKVLESTPEIQDYDCYYASVDAFHDHCYNLGVHDYAMRKVYAFANLCNMKYRRDQIVDAIVNHCMAFPTIQIQP